MKINPLDAHDRFLAFQENQTDIGKFVQQMIDKRPWGSRHFYIFIIHKKSLGLDERMSLVDQGIYKHIRDTPEAFMVVSCRVTKPIAAPNTTLIRVNPGLKNDNIVLIWSLPQTELWKQFEKGKMFENEKICGYIEQFKKDPRVLSHPDKWDPQSQQEFDNLMKSRPFGLERRIPLYAPREQKQEDIMPEI